MGEGDQPKAHYHGHRDRLRHKLLDGGAAALADYELVELLLFLGIPRRDVKPLAKALIARFGSFGALLAADPAALRAVSGMTDNAVAALKLVPAAARLLAQETIREQPVLSSWSALLDYCRIAMAHEPREQFRVLFLNQKNMLIADEVQQTGTVNHTPVYPREVMKRALELGATAIILVHNHPSGDPTASRDDLAMTRELVEAGKRIGVVIHDHLIIAASGHSSFKSLGLI